MKVLTIDLKDEKASEKLYESMKNTGFAILKNHELDSELLSSFYKQWEFYFKGTNKFEHMSSAGDGAGYFPMKSENAKGYSVKDLKEFYHLFHPYENGKIPFYSPETQEVAKYLGNLGVDILFMLNAQIKRHTGIDYMLDGMTQNSNNTLLRVLHYPPLPADAEEGAVRAAPHEDINLITLLPAATAPGLAVKDVNGEWHLLEVDAGTIVVNVGDMLQEATNGLLKSTTHQVVNPSGPLAKQSRLSSPLFVHARPEVRLSDRYTAGEYLEERLREIGLIK